MSPREIRASAIAARRQELLTVKEFAAVTGKHEQTIYRRLRLGRQPGAVRDGGGWLIDLQAALKFVRTLKSA